MKLIRHLLDMTAFMQLPKAQRRIVFYSEGKNYWVHLEGVLKEFLTISDIPVCYISSASDDPGLAYTHPRLKCFQLDEGWIRNWFFANVDTEVMVMTMPDLHQYQVKRSKHPVHYVYIHHSLVSCHMIYRAGAFDHYDTIFCAGPHHVQELRAIETHYQLPMKRLVEHGYGRLDAILAHKDKQKPTEQHVHPHVLIAPSWGQHALIETAGHELVSRLLAHQYHVTLRPHPQTLKFAKEKIEALYQQHQHNPLFTLETNVASQESLHRCDIMISDWSGAALDYAFGLEKPVLFIDVPRKVNNPVYQTLAITPLEVSIREEIGSVLPLDQLKSLPERIQKIITQKDWKSTLATLRTKHVFNVQNSNRVGAFALLELLN